MYIHTASALTPHFKNLIEKLRGISQILQIWTFTLPFYVHVQLPYENTNKHLLPATASRKQCFMNITSHCLLFHARSIHSLLCL